MGGISSAQAAQMLQGLSGSLDLTISAIPASSGSSPGYSINAIPTSGSTQLINVPIPTVNGATTGGIDFQTGKYIPTATIPVIYSYEDNGVATPTGFQGANGQLSNTYTTTINGTSYTFMLDNGNIEYAPTGSQAFAQLEFNANPNPQNAINLVNFVANQGEQEYSQNNALNQAYQNIVSGAAINTPGGNAIGGMMTMSPQDFANDTTLTQTSPGVYQATTNFAGQTYTQTINTNPPQSSANNNQQTSSPSSNSYMFNPYNWIEGAILPGLQGFLNPPNPVIPSAGSGTTLLQPQDVSAFSSESISQGNIPTALSTPGTAGQYNSQFVGLPLASSNVGIGTAAMLPNSTQYTNTNQASSSGVTPEQYLGYIASTAANLAKYLGSIPGYTPGGVPSKINGPGEI